MNLQKTLAIAACAILPMLTAGCACAPMTQGNTADRGDLAPGPGHKVLPQYILKGDSSS